MTSIEPSTAKRASERRAPHPLIGTVLSFDLTAEADELRREEPWLARGHNAKTLVKHPDFRVVLVALRRGARMKEHHTDQCVTMQTLSGRVRLHLRQETVDVLPGSLLALERTVPHEVEGIEDSVFLLSLGWSRE